MAQLVCQYLTQNTLRSGGTVFCFFDLGQIVYQGPVPAMLVHFTLVLLLNFHILAKKGHQTRSPREILTFEILTEI